jgi:hypothetical protein
MPVMRFLQIPLGIYVKPDSIVIIGDKFKTDAEAWELF